jgi:hypothetical protein
LAQKNFSNSVASLIFSFVDGSTHQDSNEQGEEEQRRSAKPPELKEK